MPLRLILFTCPPLVFKRQIFLASKNRFWHNWHFTGEVPHANFFSCVYIFILIFISLYRNVIWRQLCLLCVKLYRLRIFMPCIWFVFCFVFVYVNAHLGQDLEINEINRGKNARYVSVHEDKRKKNPALHTRLKFWKCSNTSILKWNVYELQEGGKK